VHEVLQDVYGELRDGGALASEDPAAIVEDAARRIENAWDRRTRDVSARIGERLPGLWRSIRSTWLDALRRFVGADLCRVAGLARDDLELETTVEECVALTPDLAITLRGRLDRRATREGTVEIADYKTSGSLAGRMKPLEMLRAETMQVPLYRLLAGGNARVRLLGVGPDFRFGDDEDAPVFEGWTDAEDAGFRETVATLVLLHARGTYPLRPGHHCDWCAYRGACRRAHPPTLAREENDPATLDLRDLARKKRKQPRLCDVRGTDAGGSP
jgi:hypothetical protein